MLTARELTEGLRISPPTLMRRLRSEGGAILRLGRGRACRYGRIEAWPGVGAARFPILRIDESGAPGARGELVTLASRQTAWLPDGAVSDGLPAEISDMRPSGFLRRLFAGQHSGIGLSGRLTDWSDHDALLAISRRGEDLPGNLIVGQESIDRWAASRTNPGNQNPVTPEQYPDMADAASRDAATWIGGDWPKFAAYADGRHVVVKFAGNTDVGDPATGRRRDLLALEALALDVLSEHGVPTAPTQLFSSSTCRFLEVERFDRVGERGRRATMTLAAIHHEPADSWSRAATRLLEARKVSEADARRLRLLDAFGALIGNVARHQRHVAFFPQAPFFRKEKTFVLAPAFRQRPTLRDFVMPAPSADTRDVWEEARGVALAFWQHAEEAPALSDEMRAAAGKHARLIAASA